MFKYFILPLACALLFACTPKTSSKIENKPQTRMRSIAIEDTMSSKSGEYGEMKPKTIAPKETKPYLFASLRKTNCYGYCPEYSIQIFSSGLMFFTGIRNTQLIGTYKANLNPDQIIELRKKAAELNFFELADQYPTVGKVMTEFPSTILYLKSGDKEKTVTNIHECPSDLLEYEQFIGHLVENANWIRQ